MDAARTRAGSIPRPPSNARSGDRRRRGEATRAAWQRGVSPHPGRRGAPVWGRPPRRGSTRVVLASQGCPCRRACRAAGMRPGWISVSVDAQAARSGFTQGRLARIHCCSGSVESSAAEPRPMRFSIYQKAQEAATPVSRSESWFGTCTPIALVTAHRPRSAVRLARSRPPWSMPKLRSRRGRTK